MFLSVGRVVSLVTLYGVVFECARFLVGRSVILRPGSGMVWFGLSPDGVDDVCTMEMFLWMEVVDAVGAVIRMLSNSVTMALAEAVCRTSSLRVLSSVVAGLWGIVLMMVLTGMVRLQKTVFMSD